MTKNYATSIQKKLRQQLKMGADPQRAEQQQRYMKSSIPFAGLTAPILRKTCRSIYAEFPPPSKEDWIQAMQTLWYEAKVREEKHAAIEFLNVTKLRKQWLNPEDLDWLEAIIQSGAWWDYVDAIATQHVSFLLKTFPQPITKAMYRLAQHEDVWLRRTSILSQLKFKEQTDEDLLFFAIEHSVLDNDFFARKAIGWALREYSKTKPEVVIKYIEDNHQQLSPLSKREGLKVLLKQGVVQKVP